MTIIDGVRIAACDHGVPLDLPCAECPDAAPRWLLLAPWAVTGLLAAALLAAWLLDPTR
jgi:hypothetical protein